jgi:predicted outer membrane repeat protein
MFRPSLRARALVLPALLLAVAPAAAPVLASSVSGIAPPPATRWVGAGAGCGFGSIQAAIVAANQNDIIRVAGNQNYLNQSLAIANKSITIAGGYAACGDAAPSSASTLLRGSGAGSVLFITAAGTARQVLLQRLAIWDGGPDGDGGGGIDLTGPVTLTLDGVALQRNASTNGGGLRVVGTGAASTLVRLTGGSRIGSPQNGFGNTSSNQGGGIHCRDATIDLRSGAVYGNQAGGSGGGLWLDNCTLTMTDLAPGVSVPVAIDGNTSVGWGGGLYASNGSTIQLRSTLQQRTRISDNTGTGGGGGVALTGAGTTMYADGVQITGNSTQQFGGGVRVNAGALFDMDRGNADGSNCPPPNDVQCSVLSGNSALSGGAILASGGAEADVRQTWIEGNSAGAHVVARVSDAQLVFSDNLVHANLGASYGFYFADGATASIGWSTLVHNQPTTLMRVISGSQVAVFGSVLWQDSGQVATVSDGGAITGQCLNLFEDAVLPGVTADPGFIDPDHPLRPDFRLHPDAPGVDACNAASGAPSSRDVAGQPRPFDLPGVPNLLGPHDIGAHEVGDLIFADGFGHNGLLP